MNKKDEYIWAGVVIVVAVLLVWWWGSSQSYEVAGNNATSTTKTTTTQKSTNSTPKPAPVVEDFTNLLPRIGNYKCNYDEVTQTNRSTDIVYLSNGKMRAEFRSFNAQGGTNTIMVYDGINMYKWTEGMATGELLHPKYLADFPSIIPKDILTGVSLGSGLNNASWKCYPWAVDASFLVKPPYLQV